MTSIVIEGVKLRRVVVPGNGNCLFYALSQCLFEDEKHASLIRSEVTNFVCECWDEYQCETSTPKGLPFENKEVYRNSMKETTTYGDVAEIRAAAFLFNVHVLIIENMALVADFNSDGPSKVYLEYDRPASHYSALLREANDACLADSYAPSPGSPSRINMAQAHLDSTGNDDLMSPRAVQDEVCFIGTSVLRPNRVAELSVSIDGRQSLELPCGIIRSHHLWALVFQGESGCEVPPISLGEFSAACPNDTCGAVFWEAEHLAGARRSELPYWCCGKTVRTQLSERAVFRPIQDAFVRGLYFGASPEAEHFQRHIRSYNSVLSTAMPMVKYENIFLRGGKTVKVNGKVTFKAPSCPNFGPTGIPAHHGQLYFLDLTEHVLKTRLHASTDDHLRADILESLEVYLRRHNDLIRTFQLAGRVQAAIEEKESEDSSARVALVVNPHRDGFRVTDRNLFEEDETAMRPKDSECVAAVFVGSEVRYSYDMMFHPRARTDSDPMFMEVHEASPSLDVMLYPLIHLHAEDPWVDVLMEHGSRRRRPRIEAQEVGTLRQYYSSRLMIRPGVDSGLLFKCKGLYQQWLLDAALKIMDSNMRYSESKQDELQVCQYDSLQRYVESIAASEGKQPGRVVILPSYENKSERSMYRKYMDSVRIAMEFGAPSLFITFTCNPRWPEIVANLRKRGLQPEEYMHAPDIVVRVFLARLNAFKSDVVNKSVFGRVRAYVGVTEFTTTMLPHYHMALIMHPIDRPETVADIDASVSAEIPENAADPTGHALVKALMLHRPCDGSSPGYDKPRCRSEGMDSPCKHGFPKPFMAETHIGQRGPVLRRRKTARVWHPKFRCFVDNRWVVETNVKLLKRYGAHINVRVCGTNVWFKYLFNYMQKESNGQHVQGSMLKFAKSQPGNTLDWNEIDHFKSMRLLGPYEAVYRIFGVSFVDMSHSVQSMPIHLPGKQHVYYRGDAVRAASLAENSKLLAFFRLNSTNSFAKTLLYQEVVSHFKWDKGEWTPKSVPGTTLGRLMHVNPSARNMELFCLRLLLLHTRGATSYEDLLTVNGTVHGTLKDACTASGIWTEKSPSCAESLAEVVVHASPWQIRNFFASLVVYCNLDPIKDYWVQYRDAMAEDLSRFGRRGSLLAARSEVLRLVENMTSGCRERVASELTIPGMDCDADESCCDTDLSLGAETNEQSSADSDDASLVAIHLATLTEEQRAVHDAVLESVHSEDRTRSHIISLMAPAGSGKTHVYIGIIKHCKTLGIPCVATAFTAIAALLLPDGETCHRTFGIPIRGRTDGTERSHIEASSVEGQMLHASKVIVIDECSMLSLWQVKLIDHLFRMLHGRPNVPFGGKTVLFGGDMAQILPVMPGSCAGDVIHQCLLAWDHWPERRPFELTRNMRALEDPAFAEWVACVRDGRANIHDTDDIVVPEHLLVRPVQTEGMTAYRTNKDGNTRDEDGLIESLIQRVFGDFSDARVSGGVILAPTNRDVRVVNAKVQKKLSGDETVYIGRTTVVLQDSRPNDEDTDFLITEEELNAVCASNIPPHELRLKVGSVVMLLTNMNKKQGMCNGTRFVVTLMLQSAVRVRRLVPFNGNRDEVFLPRMYLRSDDIPIAGTVQRIQFPICLAFCITTNKSQGQSMDYVGLYLRKPVFCHGQFYVAVSRGKRGDRVCIAVVNGALQGSRGNLTGKRLKPNTTKTRNIVIRSLLV